MYDHECMKMYACNTEGTANSYLNLRVPFSTFRCRIRSRVRCTHARIFNLIRTAVRRPRTKFVIRCCLAVFWNQRRKPTTVRHRLSFFRLMYRITVMTTISFASSPFSLSLSNTVIWPDFINKLCVPRQKSDFGTPKAIMMASVKVRSSM